MKVQFPKQSNADIILALRKIMEGRSLGDLVSIEDQEGDLLLKISKLGTSTLTFTRTEGTDKVEYVLSSEKIAFAHKAFKDDVKEKLVQVIQKAGGTVLS